MHPKQGTKEPGEGKGGRVKRDAQGTARDQSGPVPGPLSGCLHAGSSPPSNSSNKYSLTRTLRRRGTKLIPVTQESTGQDDRSEQLLYSSHGE